MSRFLKSLVINSLIFGILFLSAYNQPYYPATWFDEGLVLQGAINLVENGRYAMLSSEGYRMLDQPLTANGPGIVLPITAVFSIFGVGLSQARALMVIYFVLAAIMFHIIAKKLCGELPALISTLALLAIPEEGFIFYGRQALGNVPAFLYFLIGCYFLIRLVDEGHISLACLTGLFWGLTLITKSQYWIILPVFSLVFLLDILFFHKMGLKSGLTIMALTLGMLVVWQFTQYLIIGGEDYGKYIESIRSSAKETVFAFRAIRIPGNIAYLVRSGFLLFVVPGVVISVVEGFKELSHGIVRVFLSLFVISWILWYVFVSVGWHRYAFEAHSVGVLFFGVAVVRAYELWMSTRAGVGTKTISWWVSLKGFSYGLFLIAVSLWGLWAGTNQIRKVVSVPETNAQLFAEYLMRHVPHTAVIESWEWEIDALTTGLRYHHPGNKWVDRKTAELQFGDVSAEKYDFYAFAPSYLIDGPFSKWTRLYEEPLSNGCCVKLYEIGDYTLYQVVGQAE